MGTSPLPPSMGSPAGALEKSSGPKSSKNFPKSSVWPRQNAHLRVAGSATYSDGFVRRAMFYCKFIYSQRFRRSFLENVYFFPLQVTFPKSSIWPRQNPHLRLGDSSTFSENGLRRPISYCNSYMFSDSDLISCKTLLFSLQITLSKSSIWPRQNAHLRLADF